MSSKDNYQVHISKKEFFDSPIIYDPTGVKIRANLKYVKSLKYLAPNINLIQIQKNKS